MVPIGNESECFTIAGWLRRGVQASMRELVRSVVARGARAVCWRPTRGWTVSVRRILPVTESNDGTIFASEWRLNIQFFASTPWDRRRIGCELATAWLRMQYLVELTYTFLRSRRGLIVERYMQDGSALPQELELPNEKRVWLSVEQLCCFRTWR